MNKNLRSANLVVPVLLLLLAAAPVHAQGTREEQLAVERAQKAQELHPYEPDKLERRLEKISNVIRAKHPFYPFLGSLYHGGSLAAGPAYRARFADTGTFDAYAAWSPHNGTAAQATLGLPKMLSGRVGLETHGAWLDADAVEFYGIGNASSDDERFNYALRSTTAGITGRVQVAPQFDAGAGVDAVAIDTVGLDPTYARTRLFAEYDSRASDDYARAGGRYRVEAALYQQVNAGTSSFRRVDAEANQFVPVFRDNWVIALRARVAATDAAEGQHVPFYLLPSLGGSQALRGYPYGRYRDGASLLFTAEYRWTAGPFLDMAFFIDAGKVAPRLDALNLQDLTRSYGVGATLHSFETTILRIDVARTTQGARLVVSFNPSF